MSEAPYWHQAEVGSMMTRPRKVAPEPYEPAEFPLGRWPAAAEARALGYKDLEEWYVHSHRSKDPGLTAEERSQEASTWRAQFRTTQAEELWDQYDADVDGLLAKKEFAGLCKYLAVISNLPLPLPKSTASDT